MLDDGMRVGEVGESVPYSRRCYTSPRGYRDIFPLLAMVCQ